MLQYDQTMKELLLALTVSDMEVKGPEDGTLPKKLGEENLNLALDELVTKGKRFALSSEIWRCADNSVHCDVLITLAPKLTQRNAEIILQYVVQKLRETWKNGIEVEIRFQPLIGQYGLYIKGEYVSLLKTAEVLHMRKRVKNHLGGAEKDFAYDEANSYAGVENKNTFFTSGERASLVKAMLDMVRPKRREIVTLQSEEQQSSCVEFREGQPILSVLGAHKLTDQMLPPHEVGALQMLKDRWVSDFLAVQPLDDVKTYFGSQVAMYFAFLGHMTGGLWAPAILGVFIYWIGAMGSLHKAQNATDAADPNDAGENSLLTDACFVLFALFNCVWATVHLESWKRKQAEVAFKWGNLQYDQRLFDEPRAEFKGDSFEPSPVSGRLEPYYPAWKQRLTRFGLSWPLTLICLYGLFVVMFYLLKLQDLCKFYFGDVVLLSWIALLPTIVYALVIISGEAFYKELAVFLTNLENYRTQDEFENYLIHKIIAFQCVSAFGALFYIAFYLKDMERLKGTLATLLITRQIIQNCLETLLPYVLGKMKLSTLTYKMTKSMSQESLTKHAAQVRLRKETDARTNSPDAEQEKTNEGLRRRTSTRLPLPEFKVGPPERVPSSQVKETNFEVTQVELESLLPVYSSPVDDYLELFIQFGYVLLFSPAFPFAALCALLNNLFEIRLDAFKMCNNVQRPFARRVKDIGAWQRAMELMGVAGVMVNCALIGQSGLVQRFWPDMEPWEQLMLVVVLEHAVLGCKFGLDLAIPDVPEWIRIELAKSEHRRMEQLKKKGSSLASDQPKFGTDHRSMVEHKSPEHTARYRSVTPMGYGRLAQAKDEL